MIRALGSDALASRGITPAHFSEGFPLPKSHRMAVSYKAVEIISWLFPFTATHLLFPASFDIKRQILSHSHQKQEGRSVSPTLGFGLELFGGQKNNGKSSLVLSEPQCVSPRLFRVTDSSVSETKQINRHKLFFMIIAHNLFMPLVRRVHNGGYRPFLGEHGLQVRHVFCIFSVCVRAPPALDGPFKNKFQVITITC